MERFASQYGFQFVCHEKGHANRKAGNERGFYTVETNFFPGRSFESIVDMNHQAFEWATQRSANRPTGKTRLIPSMAFEHEKSYLKKLPPYIEPPYRVHERGTDQYAMSQYMGTSTGFPGQNATMSRSLNTQTILRSTMPESCWAGIHSLPMA